LLIVFQNLLDGNWSPWSVWSSCSLTCGGGNQTQTRTCTNPPPSNGGKNCSTTNIESIVQPCNIQLCPTSKNYFLYFLLCYSQIIFILFWFNLTAFKILIYLLAHFLTICQPVPYFLTTAMLYKDLTKNESRNANIKMFLFFCIRLSIAFILILSYILHSF